MFLFIYLFIYYYILSLCLSQKATNLLMFDYAVDHAARIARVLKCPGGHALLIGHTGIIRSLGNFKLVHRLWQAISHSIGGLCASIRYC